MKTARELFICFLIISCVLTTDYEVDSVLNLWLEWQNLLTTVIYSLLLLGIYRGSVRLLGQKKVRPTM